MLMYLEIASLTSNEKQEIIQKFPFADKLDAKQRYLLHVLTVLGQADRIFPSTYQEEHWPQVKSLLDNLQEVEDFYKEEGGLLGYHRLFLDLVKNDQPSRKKTFIQPPIIDIRKDFSQIVQTGLQHLPEMAFAFPLGGAADRLNLIDPESHSSLPASLLP